MRAGFCAKTCLADEKLELNKFDDGIGEPLWASGYIQRACLGTYTTMEYLDPAVAPPPRAPFSIVL